MSGPAAGQTRWFFYPGFTPRTGGLLREADLLKPPGVAESLDWAEALHLLGVRELTPETAARTLGAVLKYREDSERVIRDELDAMLSR